MSTLEDWLRQDEELFLKNVTLSTEFNKYLVEHPEVAEQIPKDAAVVLLPEDDPEFRQKVLSLIEHHRRIDDFRDRPVVYVRIERLAPPPPSRLVNRRVEEVIE